MVSMTVLIVFHLAAHFVVVIRDDDEWLAGMERTAGESRPSILPGTTTPSMSWLWVGELKIRQVTDR